MTVRTSRKSFLRGVGAAALAAPFLRLLERPARAAIAPRRIVFVATPGGMGNIMGDYWPGAGPLDLGGNAVLAPLAPLASKLIVMRGLDNAAALKPPAVSGHGEDYPSLLVGRSARPTSSTGTRALPTGISLDQFLAQELARAPGAQTRLRYLNLGVQSSIAFSPLSARGPDLPVPFENSPQKAFDALFAGFAGPGGPDPAFERLRADRLSVLDRVRKDLAALRAQLGATEREKLDSHVEAVRDLERTLAFAPPPSASCTRPARDPIGPDFPTVGSQHLKLVRAALACDLTRVVTVMWSRGVSQVVHRWADPAIDMGHHELSHDNNRAFQETKRRWLVAIERFYAGKLFELCKMLDETPDVDGRKLLDNTVVVWVHEQGHGGSHSRLDHAVVLAGSCGGHFRTGRAVHAGGAPYNSLLVTLAHAMGVPVATFGDQSIPHGPLADLRG